MRIVRRHEINAAITEHRPPWLTRLWNHLLEWQAVRARRVIIQHADLNSNGKADFAWQDATATRNASAVWNAVLHGTTCEGSFGTAVRDCR